jgi:hypothetical protein
MRENQMQVASSFAAKMTNSKYVNQKKKIETELKIFRDHFNYGKTTDFLFDTGK